MAGFIYSRIQEESVLLHPPMFEELLIFRDSEQYAYNQVMELVVRLSHEVSSDFRTSWWLFVA